MGSAPHHWMLGKLDGIWAPRPSSGPHKLRECLPLVIILRNRLKYALTKQEVTMICMEKLVKVDGKTRIDPDFPAGFMDVIKIEKSGDTFRYADPLIKVDDTVKIDLATGKIIDFIKFETGNLVIITRGRNAGRVGILNSIERHQ